VRSKFSCVRSFHNMCACAHTHSLEGTLVQSVCKTEHSKLSHPWWVHAHTWNRPTVPVDIRHGRSESQDQVTSIGYRATTADSIRKHIDDTNKQKLTVACIQLA